MSHSQLQQQVLSLYRQLLRVTKHKPGFNSFIRHEFKKNKEIPKRDILHIEHALRRGKQKLILFKKKEVQSLGVFTKDEKDPTK